MAFDVNALLAATTTNAGSTEFMTLPTDEEFVANLRIDSDPEKAFKQGVKDGRPWLMLNVQVELSGARIAELLAGRDKRTIQWGIPIDLTPSGGLDMGKGMNVTLNKLREETGQRREGQPWGFKDLNGQTIRVKIKHRKVDDKVFEDIGSFSKF